MLIPSHYYKMHDRIKPMGKKIVSYLIQSKSQLCYNFYLRIVNYLKVKLNAYAPALILLLCRNNQVQTY